MSKRTCPECGGPLSDCRSPRCGPCYQSELLGRQEQMLSLWNAGFTGIEVATVMGLTANHVGSEVHRLRKKGWPFKLHRGRSRGRWPEIQRRMDEGESNQSIAAALGISIPNLRLQQQAMSRCSDV